MKALMGEFPFPSLALYCTDAHTTGEEKVMSSLIGAKQAGPWFKDRIRLHETARALKHQSAHRVWWGATRFVLGSRASLWSSCASANRFAVRNGCASVGTACFPYVVRNTQ